MLTRLPNWQSQLSDYLISVAYARFAYGGMDCGLFVAGAIAAMTGVDTAVNLRGKYRSRTQAFELIRAETGRRTMEAIAEKLAGDFGLQEVGILRAERGDPIMMGRGWRSSLGIVAMHGTELLTPFRHGLLRLPLSHATRAWHI
jgi:hypothetical protein